MQGSAACSLFCDRQRANRKSQPQGRSRPCFCSPYLKSQALCQGDYREVLLTNRQYIFQRQVEGERVLVVVNADSHPYTAHFDAGCGRAVDLLTGKNHDFGGGSELPPYSVAFWRCER